MADPLSKVLKDLGRSIVGALLLGMPLLYTMETWWLGWRLPALVILLYALLGLLVVFAVVNFIGFKPEHERLRGLAWLRVTGGDFLELVLTSFVAAWLVLLLFGVLETDSSFHDVVRLSAMQIVPLGFGAAVANRVLSGSSEQASQSTFRQEMGVFAMGAVFFALPVAPTEEMELMAAHAGWTRLALVVVASLLLGYLALYELEFRGAKHRAGRLGSPWLQWGETAAGYVVALLVSAALLAAYGHFTDAPFETMVQETVVLGFLASLGGAAARVVI